MFPFASSSLFVSYTGATGGMNLNNQSLANVSAFGIGTTTPSSLLTIADSTSTNMATFFSSTTAYAVIDSNADIITTGNIDSGVFPSFSYNNSFAVNPTSPGRNSDDIDAGFKFSVNAPTTVTELGRFYAAGSTQDHIVYLWDTSNSTAPIAEATVLASSPTDANGFKWTAITPVTLSPTKTYAIVVREFLGGDVWNTLWAPTLASDFTEIGNCYTYTLGVLPSCSSDGQAYGDPAMAYNLANFATANLEILGSGNTDLANILSSSSADALTITANGNVGIGTENPLTTLSVSGNISGYSQQQLDFSDRHHLDRQLSTASRHRRAVCIHIGERQSLYGRHIEPVKPCPDKHAFRLQFRILPRRLRQVRLPDGRHQCLCR